MSETCAAIVARDDPHLHATALFAAEPGRSRLMVLYAFDIELGRAAAASAEPLVAGMRLQWWRDVVEAARAGAPAPEHEVAGPFARLLAERDLPGEAVEGLIAAREAELEGGFDSARFAVWADARFGGLTALATHLLTSGDPETVALARRAGPVLGAAFTLRHAAAAGQADALLPDLAPEDRGPLARGELTPHARAVIGRVTGEALARLAELRTERRRIDPRATPALLPLVRAKRVLGQAARMVMTARAEGFAPPQPFPHGGEGGWRRSGRASVGLGELDAQRPFDGLRLAWAAATGRW